MSVARLRHEIGGDGVRRDQIDFRADVAAGGGIDTITPRSARKPVHLIGKVMGVRKPERVVIGGESKSFEWLDGSG